VAFPFGPAFDDRYISFDLSKVGFEISNLLFLTNLFIKPLGMVYLPVDFSVMVAKLGFTFSQSFFESTRALLKRRIVKRNFKSPTVPLTKGLRKLKRFGQPSRSIPIAKVLVNRGLPHT